MESIKDIPEFAEGAVILSGYEIESAITNTVCAAKEADGVTLVILQSHLKNLCNLQLKALIESVYQDRLDD